MCCEHMKHKLRVLTGSVKRFIRLCSPCKFKDELKRVQNTSLAHGYPGNLIYKVITRARSSNALKIIGQVYLKLPFVGSISEKYSKTFFEKVSHGFCSVY